MGWHGGESISAGCEGVEIGELGRGWRHDGERERGRYWGLGSLMISWDLQSRLCLPCSPVLFHASKQSMGIIGDWGPAKLLFLSALSVGCATPAGRRQWIGKPEACDWLQRTCNLPRWHDP